MKQVVSGFIGGALISYATFDKLGWLSILLIAGVSVLAYSAPRQS